MTCAHFGPCGGCQLQDVPYPDQLTQKQATLAGLLGRRLGSRAPEVRPTIGMPVAPDGMPWGFRHKAAFVFGPDPRSRRGFVMGHYAAGSKTIVPVSECPVHSARANRIAFALRDRLARAGVTAAGPRLDGVLRHVVIRTTHDEREAIAMLVVTENDKALRAPLRGLLASPERPDGLFVSIHAKPGPYMVGEETIHIDGRTNIREHRLGPAFLVSPTAFFQTNPDAAAVLVDEVVEGAARADGGRPLQVLDLYAGSGLFALPLAAAGHTVTAVEENAQAIRDGQANQRVNHVPRERLRFVRGRVEDMGTGTIFRGMERKMVPVPMSPDLVVLDPPRQGCPPEVVDAIFRRLAPPAAIYVSCNPESLAADLPSIVEAGYRITRVQPVDMFPHTPHIETVVTLHRRGR